MFRLWGKDGKVVDVDQEFVDECVANIPVNPKWVEHHLSEIKLLILAKKYNAARVAMRQFGEELGT